MNTGKTSNEYYQSLQKMRFDRGISFEEYWFDIIGKNVYTIVREYKIPNKDFDKRSTILFTEAAIALRQLYEGYEVEDAYFKNFLLKMIDNEYKRQKEEKQEIGLKIKYNYNKDE